MMYLSFKLIHILSAIILFGLGLGTVFYKIMADKSGNLATIAMTSRHVVLADLWFTTPTVIIQPVTGFLLAQQLSLPLSASWLNWSLILYVITGLCWLPVLILQVRMRDIANLALMNNQLLPSIYRHYTKVWLILGVPAFFGMIIITTLMVFHHSLWS
ncbi:MAG: DUF2269 domain-containing protein [Methylococcaceae bacterium]